MAEPSDDVVTTGGEMWAAVGLREDAALLRGVLGAAPDRADDGGDT